MNGVLVGDALQVLRTLPDESVQCVVTSPPYWGGMRDYGVAGQLGVEATLNEYVSKLVDILNEVRRVLRSDGLLWLNLGDCFREGQLQGVPWRVAFSLQSADWLLRMDVVWNKPNPMPENVRNRPTKAHEYLFMFAKNQRYYYDMEAVREPLSPGSVERYKYSFGGAKNEALKDTTKPTAIVGYRKPTPGRNKRSVWDVGVAKLRGRHFAPMPEPLVEPCILSSTRPGDAVLDPFVGSGTVCRVARRLGRNYVGIELNPDYADMALRRIEEIPYGNCLEAA